MLLSPHLHVSRSVNYSPCMHKTELWIALAYIIHFAIYLLSLADSNILILHYYYTSDICLLIQKLFLSALSFMLIFKWNGLCGTVTVVTWVLYFAYHAKLVMSCVFVTAEYLRWGPCLLLVRSWAWEKCNWWSEGQEPWNWAQESDIGSCFKRAWPKAFWNLQDDS